MYIFTFFCIYAAVTKYNNFIMIYLFIYLIGNQCDTQKLKITL